jgi:hypothetical protein
MQLEVIFAGVYGTDRYLQPGAMSFPIPRAGSRRFRGNHSTIRGRNQIFFAGKSVTVMDVEFRTWLCLVTLANIIALSARFHALRKQQFSLPC